MDGFFSYFVLLKTLILDGNRLKSLSKIEFVTPNIDHVSFRFNQLELVDEISFSPKDTESLRVSQINLDNNQLRSFPRIVHDSSVLFDIRILNLSNNSLEEVKEFKLNFSVQFIDLSANKLDVDTLCDLFFDLESKVSVKVNYFPQFLDSDLNPTNCYDLEYISFSLGSNKNVEINGCALKDIESNSSYCFTRSTKRLARQLTESMTSGSAKYRFYTYNNLFSGLFILFLILTLALTIYIML